MSAVVVFAMPGCPRRRCGHV